MSENEFDRRSMRIVSFSCCPHCHGIRIKRNGKRDGRQRWICKDCGRTFGGRCKTILHSSKLNVGQIREIVSLLEDGVLTHQVAHRAHVSVQTVVLWKRKLQILEKSQESVRLSGKVWVDETYINVPSKERGPSKRGLSGNKQRIFVGVDDSGHALARIDGKGIPGNEDSSKAFRGHVAEGSAVCHDEGHYAGAFPGCKEVPVNSRSKGALKALNPINRFCSQVKRLFRVHLRIRPKNRQKYLDEMVNRREASAATNFDDFLGKMLGLIFLSGKTLRRREVSAH